MPDPRAGREESLLSTRRVAEKAGFRSAAAVTAADGTGMIQYLANLAAWPDGDAGSAGADGREPRPCWRRAGLLSWASRGRPSPVLNSIS